MGVLSAKHIHTALLTLGLVALLAAFALSAGCTADAEQPPSGSLGSGPDYYGPATLEERIAGADAIIRARLLLVTAVSEQLAGQTGYFAALDYKFQVVEYLSGSGSGELVGVVHDASRSYGTAAGAIGAAKTLKEGRDTQWDDREAIVFLIDEHPGLPSSYHADRYRLGSHYAGEDYYTIASRDHKRWLPASAGGASGTGGASGSGEQSFLLDKPLPASGGASGESGQSEPAPTITLADMKAKIAAFNQEVTAGGGSEAYKDCLYLKLKWEREVLYRKERRGGNYFRVRYDESISSGMAAETLAHISVDASFALSEEGPTAPTDDSWGEYWVVGRDGGLFQTRWPGEAVTARPLPAGVYRFYWVYLPPQGVICNAMPEDELKRLEVFVTVTAPTGTLHELFFDPVTVGNSVAADATNGTLKPTAFTGAGGASAAIGRIAYESGQVKIKVTPVTALTSQVVEVIELDGAGSLSLRVANATVDTANNTLSWSVSSQPWNNGDKLMVRIHDGSAAAPAPVH